jgi:hypothetical protein
LSSVGVLKGALAVWGAFRPACEQKYDCFEIQQLTAYRVINFATRPIELRTIDANNAKL